MKKIFCLLLALSMTALFFACDRLPEGVENDARPVSTEPSTEAPTEKPTEAPEEPTEEIAPVLREITEEFQTGIVAYVKNRLYCEEDKLAYGCVSFTDLSTGEAVENINGFYFAATDFIGIEDIADWRKAVDSADGLFEDATCVVRVASLKDENWYVEFHNGKDAKYLYFSELDLFVPVISHYDQITETINTRIDDLLDYYFMLEPDFRVEGSTLQKVAENYCARVLQRWQIKGTRTGRYTGVSIDSITYELQNDGKTLRVFYEMTATALTESGIFTGHVWENEDGSQTCAMESTLCLDEDGKWFDASAQDFFLDKT